MSSGGGAAPRTKHKHRAKPMAVPHHARPPHLLSPSTNPFASDDEPHPHPPMLKIALTSISKLEVRNLKRRLTSELDQVRTLISQFDSKGGSFTANKGRNKKLKTTATDKGTVQILKKCSNLLTKLMKHKDGWVFNVPVDAKGFGLHDYHTIVKEPMDLGTVKSKLGGGLYETPLEFADDVRLTFNNAVLYNPVGHEVHSMAKSLLSLFEEKWVPIELQYRKARDVVLPRPIAPAVEALPAPTPSPSPPAPAPAPLPPAVLEDRALEIAESMTTPLEAETVAGTTDLEKPGGEEEGVPEEVEEAPVDDVRDLTMDEKRRLSEELQDLPYDKLETVVQIVKKSNPELSQQDDEIELDIDSLDIGTLWELYSFVTGYKESLSNNKKEGEDQGFGSERDAESAHNIIQEPTTLATGTETSRVTESGKGIRMSSPTRQENKAGGSSSSNSSSSDSGSSSSDSDSDSSSGRGSDTGN